MSCYAISELLLYNNSSSTGGNDDDDDEFHSLVVAFPSPAFPPPAAVRLPSSAAVVCAVPSPIHGDLFSSPLASPLLQVQQQQQQQQLNLTRAASLGVCVRGKAVAARSLYRAPPPSAFKLCEKAIESNGKLLLLSDGGGGGCCCGRRRRRRGNVT